MSTSYGAPSAVVAYEMTKDTNNDTNELLWLAIVGLTSYYVQGDIDHGRYLQLLQDVRIDVSSKNGPRPKTMTSGENPDGTGGTEIPVAEDGRIEDRLDYRFMLYRHWNLYDAMTYSDYVATSMQLWTAKGRANLERLIAKIGIPLKDCRQKFAFMSERLKERLRDGIDASARDFDLDEVRFDTFAKRDGFAAPISAADVVYGTTALLECDAIVDAAVERRDEGSAESNAETNENQTTTKIDGQGEEKIEDVGDTASLSVPGTTMTKRWEDRFNLAFDSLRKNNDLVYKHGIARAMRLQRVVFEMATSVIERKRVRNSGPFRYTILQNLTASESSFFVQPRVLARLAKFVVNAYIGQGKWTDRRAKPYVVCVPNETRGTHLVVGVMCPGRFEVERNYLGRAFRIAAIDVGAKYKHDGFDTAAIELGKETGPTQFLSVLHDTLSG